MAGKLMAGKHMAGKNAKKHRSPASKNDLIEFALMSKLLSDGWSQATVANLMFWAEHKVSRNIEKAEEHGFLRQEKLFKFDPSEIEEQDVMEEFQRRYDEIQLGQRLANLPWVKESGVSLVPLSSGGSKSFDQRAGDSLGKAIVSSPDNICIGVMWGGVIESVINSLKSHFEHHKPPANDRICIPLCGEPIGVVRNSMPRYSSSYLAAELHRALHGNTKARDHDEQPLLGGVPAYVPTHMDNDAVQQYLDRVPCYQKIFNEESGLINQLDMVITGLGTFGVEESTLDDSDGWRPTTGIFLRERIALEEGRMPNLAEDLKKYAVGDVGGVIVPRTIEEEQPGEKANRLKLIEKLNKGWKGAKLKHLERCARPRKKKQKRSGVVAIAHGAHKVDIVRFAVTKRLVSSVICDESLAKALLSSD